MKKFASVIVVASLFLTAASVAMRADHAHAGQNLRDAKWSPAPPFLPKGAQIAVLEGDPSKPGLYAVRLKFPEHYAIPAHSHPTNEHVVVTSGALVFGMAMNYIMLRVTLQTGGSVPLFPIVERTLETWIQRLV